MGKHFTQLWAWIFLTGITIVLLYPVAIGRTASFIIKQDNVHQGYPFINKLSSSLHKGYFPVWDANTYGGRSFAGEIQPGIFYPVSIAWCLLFGSVGGIDVYYLDLLVCLHYLICLLGMYRLARVFRLPSTAAVAAALVFTFTSSLSFRSSGQTWTFFGVTLLPWVLCFVARYYLVRRRKRCFIFAGLVAGMQILAGHIQPFFHTVLIAGIFILFYEARDRRGWKGVVLSGGTHLVLLVLSAALIALPQLYYTAQYLPDCYRYVSGGQYIRMGQKVPLAIYAHWFTITLSNIGNLFGQPFAQPDDDNTIYMGILPLLLVIVYLLRKKTLKLMPPHAGLTRLLLIVLGVGVLSVLGYVTFFSLILYYLPLVNTVRELGRYVVLISFSGSLLTGLAIAYLPELKEQLFQRNGRTKVYVLAILGVNALYLLAFQRDAVPFAVSVSYLLAIGFLLWLATNESGANLTLPAIAVICLDLLLNRVNFLSTQYGSYPSNYYSRNRIVDSLEKTYGKYRVDFKMEDYSRVWRNLGDLYNIQIKTGYTATINNAYFEFIYGGQGPDSQIDDLLNIRYILADRRLDSNYIFKDSVRQFLLYERKNYYPRCYWKRQLGERGERIEAENKASVRPLAYSDLEQKVAVDCAVPDTLIFSENYYPGWKCYDNGKEVTIYRASIGNYRPLFRCIALDRGHHDVEFRYNKVFYFF